MITCSVHKFLIQGINYMYMYFQIILPAHHFPIDAAYIYNSFFNKSIWQIKILMFVTIKEVLCEASSKIISIHTYLELIRELQVLNKNDLQKFTVARGYDVEVKTDDKAKYQNLPLPTMYQWRCNMAESGGDGAERQSRGKVLNAKWRKLKQEKTGFELRIGGWDKFRGLGGRIQCWTKELGVSAPAV